MLLRTSAALAVLTAGVQLESRVEEGETRTRSFLVETELELEEMIVAVEGEEVDSSMLGEMAVHQLSKIEVAVTDVFDEVEGGEATRFRRTYDGGTLYQSMDQEMEMSGDRAGELEGASRLEDETVEFVREGDGWIARWPDGEEGDDELLERLTADLELAELLPPGEVAVGDTWELDPSLFLSLFHPVGDLKLELDESGDAPPTYDADVLFEESVEVGGELGAELTGFREEDGRRVAVVALRYDLSWLLDLTEIIHEDGFDTEGPDGMDIEVELVSSELESDHEGEGELLWDLERNALVALDLEGSSAETNASVIGVKAMGQEFEQEQIQVLSGSHRIEVRCEIE